MICYEFRVDGVGVIVICYEGVFIAASRSDWKTTSLIGVFFPNGVLDIHEYIMCPCAREVGVNRGIYVLLICC